MLRDCALLPAIPLSHPSLAAALGRSDGTDFAAQIHALFERSSEVRTWEGYKPLAQYALMVIEEARRAGVTVIRDASLDAWTMALTRFPVVTLVAHWRSSTIQAQDIQRVDALWTAIGDPASPLWPLLRRFGAGIAEPEAYEAAPLAVWLNHALERDASSDEQGSAEAIAVGREHRCYSRRKELEHALPGVFRGGAAVEFGDGFKSVGEVLDAVDPRIRGAVDLTVCNSVVLGEEIRRKCHRCMVMMNARPASLAFRLALYRQAVQLMKNGGRSYPDTMMRLRQHVVDNARSAASAGCSHAIDD